MAYDVILTGFQLNTDEAPAQILERVLGLDAAKAQLATQRFPVILARTTPEKAERIAHVLREAGADVELRESPEAAPRAVAPPPPPPRPPPANGGPPAPAPLPDLPPVPKLAPQPVFAPVAAMEGGRAPSMTQLEPARVGAPGLPTMLGHVQNHPAPTAAPASVLSAVPANDQGLGLASAPGPAGAPSAPPARPMTAYQIGELSLGPAPAPAPKPAPAPVPVATPALEIEAPIPAPAATAAPRKQAPAPAPAPAADDGGGFGGMQSFGDGLDDFDQQKQAPALELDTDAAWLKKQKPAPVPQRAPAPPPAEDGEEAPYRESAQRPRAPQQPYVLPPPPPFHKRIIIAIEDALAAAKPIVINFMIFLVVICLSAAAAVFARNPDAAFELAGLSSPPPELTSLSIPVVSATAVPDFSHDARFHPLLRAAPQELELDTLRFLRARVPGVHHVNVSWPRRSELALKDLECVLVEQAANDPKGRALISHVHALLRTGHALELPEGIRAELARAKEARRKSGRANARFVDLCLAI